MKGCVYQLAVSCCQSFGPVRLWPNAGDPGLATAWSELSREPVSGFALFDHTAVSPLTFKLAGESGAGGAVVCVWIKPARGGWWAKKGPRNPTCDKSWAIKRLVTKVDQTFSTCPMSTQQSLRAAARAEHAVSKIY